MDAERPVVVSLSDPSSCPAAAVGGKAANLARLAATGSRVPAGFVVTVAGYEQFVDDARLRNVVRMELGRKRLDDMRWEELWDAALRVRTRFRAAPVPSDLHQAVAAAVDALGADRPLAVRSSAIDEDSAGRSFAGLHESVVGVRGIDEVLGALRLVWASLWSDAALLYRRELALNPETSGMAVVIQQLVESDRSGVAFGRHPTRPAEPLAVVEAVPGACQLLVDGVVEPDRWELDRHDGTVTAWVPGRRETEAASGQLLDPPDLLALLGTLTAVERELGWPPDMEWTGRRDTLTVLQARPITTAEPDPDDRRAWYLSLRPGDAKLRKLRTRVADQLIPELEAEGGRLAAEDLATLSDRALADAIDERVTALTRWRRVYEADFIPFAHGVRRLGTYYNDAVLPDDPYEFVGLLRDQPLLATQRNTALSELASEVTRRPALHAAIAGLLERRPDELTWEAVRQGLAAVDGGPAFADRAELVSRRFLDIAFKHARLAGRAGALLRTVIELASRDAGEAGAPTASEPARAARLLARLKTAVGPGRQTEAMEVVETARVSWRLRDDDNVLLARIESQLLRAMDVAAGRLRAQDRLAVSRPLDEKDAPAICDALRHPAGGTVPLEPERPLPTPANDADPDPGAARSRQLVGQPASVGLATGRARHVRTPADLAAFRLGDVLVCDAIQPTMTHLVPLACAIVERRGGMLIHGAIIARELGIPCVNGVSRIDDLQDGDLVTVDGHLGIVTLGEPEFDLERARAAAV